MDRETLLRNFGTIAFGSEHRVATDDRLAKWRRPIRYEIDNEADVGAPTLPALHRHMQRLLRITTHPIRKAAQGPANFTVILTNRSRYRKHLAASLRQPNPWLVARLARADCAGVYQRRKDTNEIVRAVAIIPVDRARKRGVLQHCIVEETTQLMGLPNDSDDARGSLFNDRSRRSDLHCQDRLYLRLLYHPRLMPGMRKPAALAVAGDVLSRLTGSR